MLVFTHTGLITQVLGASTASNPACWSRFRAARCSITEISRRDDAAPAVLGLTDVRHLAPSNDERGQHQ